MCLDSVRQLQSPNPEVAKGRLYLQLLAGGLFIVSLFALLAGQLFSIFFMMILGFILYMSWGEFSFELTLNFMLVCVLQYITTYVDFIGLIEYYSELSSENSTKVLLLIVKMVYYPNAIYFSHEAYKKFKHYAKYNMENQKGGDYQMMPMSNSQQVRTNQALGNRNFMPFQGSGTVIG